MDGRKPRAAICTLGCRVNQYESEAVEAELAMLGFEILNFVEICDVYIINTCAVTGESERKSKQMIRRAKALNPDAYILVMGCFSQIAEEEVKKMDGVSYVCGNRNKLTVAETAVQLVKNGGKVESAVLDVEHTPLENMTVSRAFKDRCFVKVEDGCDNHCTYCIIKKARGNVVSRKPEDVMREVSLIAKDGCHEVILTGIESASYGMDIGEYSLADLMVDATKIPGIERVRCGSLEPSVLRPKFCDTLASEKKILPSFHLSLQSGSNKILRLMKRKYNREQVLAHVDYLKSVMPGVTFTCDIIVGFPGETEEDFMDTVDIAKKIGFLHMHIFPFSKREGTEAAVMENQIPETVKKDRVHRLEEVGKEIADAIYNGATGQTRSVLFESRHGEYFYGHTEDMLEIKLLSKENLQGQIHDVILQSYDGTRMLAVLKK